MTTVRQFIEFLRTLPQDAEVETLRSSPGCGWEGGDYALFDSFDEKRDVEVVDFTDNQFVKKDAPHYGKVFVRIGEKT